MTTTWHIHTLCGKGKGKGQVHPRTGHEGPKGKQRYSSTLSLTSALDGSGWSMPCPSSFTPGKDPIPIVWEAWWAPGPVGMGAQNLVPHWDLIPGPSSPYWVPILTELSQPNTLSGQNTKLPNIQAHGTHIYQVNHWVTSYLLLSYAARIVRISWLVVVHNISIRVLSLVPIPLIASRNSLA